MMMPYFSNNDELIKIIQSTRKSNFKHFCSNNLDKIKNIFNWDKIISDYNQLLTQF